MKVLLIHDFGALAGGAERIAIDLRDGLRERGHTTRLFATRALTPPLANEADDLCFGHTQWPRLLLQVANPWAVSALRKVLTAFQPDIIHVRMFLSQLSPAILPLLGHVPSLLHIGNHQTICPINSRVLPDQSRCAVPAGLACYRNGCVSALGLARTLLQLGAWRKHRKVFRLIVANSAALAKTLRENEVDVQAVVPNGTRIAPARGALSDPPTIAFAGRLVKQKGVDVLLRAMATIVQQRPDARLLIAGEGEERRRLETQIEALSLGAQVHLLGHLARPEMDRALASTWVQAVPSSYPEPCANVIPEAMMRGSAIVGTDCGGTPEAIDHGVTGFLVPPFNPDELATRLLQILNDRTLAERMGSAARSKALSELTTARMLDRFESLYAKLLHQGDAR